MSLPCIFCEEDIDVCLGDLHCPQGLHQLFQQLYEKVFDLFVVRKADGDSDDAAGEAFETTFELLTGFGPAELAVGVTGGCVNDLKTRADDVSVFLVPLLKGLK